MLVLMGDVLSLKRGARWFPIAMVALPLGVFSAIMFAPSLGDGTDASAASRYPPPIIPAADPGPGTAAELDAAQPYTDPELLGQRTEPLPGQVDRLRARFSICSGPRRITCVVDGDTIWFRGAKIRLVGFDAPEISNPGCKREAWLGAIARQRLQEWLNEDAFSLEPNPDGRSKDRYGRSLRVVSRGGENVGETLLDRGLAERRGGRRIAWC